MSVASQVSHVDRQKQCVKCEKKLGSIDDYIVHLLEKHEVPSTKASLVQLGLGQCPFCDKFFAASRGWSKHVTHCKFRVPNLNSEIKWPKTCWVWWKQDHLWYKGAAQCATQATQPSYKVLYPDEPKKEFIELSQMVVFTDPTSVVPDFPPMSSPAIIIPEVIIPAENVQFIHDGEYEEGEIMPSPPVAECKKTLDDLLPEWFITKSCIPDIVSSKEDLKAVIIDMHRASSQLRRLPPLRLWRGNQRRMWARCTKQFTDYFQAAILRTPSSPEFLKLCLRLLELPAIILAQTLPAPKSPSDARASLSFKLRKAEGLAFQDRLHEAPKVLFSHGVTRRSV